MKKNHLTIHPCTCHSVFNGTKKTVYHTHPEVLFNQGKEMFLEGNWVGAQELLTGFATLSNDSYLKEEAAYMVAISSFHRGNKTSGNILKEFLTKYPETIHRHQVNFLIGSYYYDKRDWETAGIWFGLTDLDYLTLTEQEDYSFRSGYTQLQSGNKEEARRYFGLLSQTATNIGMQPILSRLYRIYQQRLFRSFAPF